MILTSGNRQRPGHSGVRVPPGSIMNSSRGTVPLTVIERRAEATASMPSVQMICLLFVWRGKHRKSMTGYSDSVFSTLGPAASTVFQCQPSEA